MRILCVSAPLPGHLDWGGYLATARALVQRGHSVLWVTGVAARDMVAHAGVPVHVVEETGWRWPPPPPLQPHEVASAEEYRRLRRLRSLDQWLDPDRVAQATEELLEAARAFRPQLIAGEIFVPAAALAAEALDLPFVVVGWPALRTRLSSQAQEVETQARERLARLLARFGLPGRCWELQGPPAPLSPLLHLTYWSPSWYRGLPLLPQTAMVGGVPPPPRPLTAPELQGLAQDRPWVLVTLGTAFTQDPNFFVAAAQAVHRVGGIPLVALGMPMTAALARSVMARLPGEAVVVERVEFAQVLPRIAAAIHHGGAGTTHGLVVHGVPQVVVPHAADQARQAQGVVRTGVGLAFRPREVTVARLAQALAALLPDTSPFRERARRLQEEFAALGGVPRAATLLERLDAG